MPLYWINNISFFDPPKRTHQMAFINKYFSLVYIITFWGWESELFLLPSLWFAQAVFQLFYYSREVLQNIRAALYPLQLSKISDVFFHRLYLFFCKFLRLIFLYARNFTYNSKIFLGILGIQVKFSQSLENQCIFGRWPVVVCKCSFIAKILKKIFNKCLFS